MEIAARRKNTEWWSGIFKKRALEASRRRNYGITEFDDGVEGRTRGIISHNVGAEGSYLEYYPLPSGGEKKKIDIEDLQTGRSENDRGLKMWTTFLLASTFVVFWVGPFIYEVGTAELLGDNEYLKYAIIVGAPIVIVFVILISMSWPLAIRFNDMDKHWKNAINRCMDSDIMQRMFGIRQCMLEFRRYIKWRRFMNYVTFFYLAGMVVSIALIAFFLNEMIDGAEVAYILTSVVMQCWVIAYYWDKRWFETNWRDPTLQLCVVMVDENTKAVINLRAGLPK